MSFAYALREGWQVSGEKVEFPEDIREWRCNGDPVRVQVLKRALDLTVSDRNRVYGDPVRNMQTMSTLLSVLTGREFTASDCVRAMVAAKLSRLVVSPYHADSLVDLVAYCAILAEVQAAGSRLVDEEG